MENAEPRHAIPRPTLHTNQRPCTTSCPRLSVGWAGEGGGWQGNGEKGFASCLLPFRAVDAGVFFFSLAVSAVPVVDAGVFLRVIGSFDVCLVAIDVY